MFELKAESHTNVTVLRFSGNLLLPDVAEFSKLLEEHLLAPNIRQVVLDLSHVEKSGYFRAGSAGKRQHQGSRTRTQASAADARAPCGRTVAQG